MRALMLIVSDDDIHARIYSEIKQHDITTAAGIADLTLLDGCLQEAMRLWPTTPVLARKIIRRTVIAGSEVAAGTQVMILNNVLHRNTRLADDANMFRPARWTEEIPPYTYNAMSNGTQGCAGRHLALLLGKFVLGTTSDPLGLLASIPIGESRASLCLISMTISSNVFVAANAMTESVSDHPQGTALCYYV